MAEHQPDEVSANDGSAGSASDATVFEAIIAPHQSMGRRGSFILMGILFVLVGGLSVRFWLIGAWPVICFSVVELPLAALMLALSRRRGRVRERIALSPAAITVVRTDHHGRRQSFSLPSAWLQVRLEIISGGASRILLRSHGRGREVGAFLHDSQRQSLFAALQDALHQLRNPRFENEL